MHKQQEAGSELLPLDKDHQLVQTNQKFVGNALWYIFDLATFGAFEKPKNRTKKANVTKPANATNSTKIIYQKVVEYKYINVTKNETKNSTPPAPQVII